MKPNILFLFPDQHRGDWMPYDDDVRKRLGVSDLHLEMKNIKSMMKKGVTFTRAYSSSPICAPARACLASGMRYFNCRVMDNNVNYDVCLPTFYSVLKDNNYSVGSVGKLDLNKAEFYWGENGWRKQLGEIGFTTAIDNEGKQDGATAYFKGIPGPYVKELIDNGVAEEYCKDISTRKNKTHPGKVSDELYCDNYITRNGINMINDFPKDKPWFLQVNFAGPHGPWDITESMADKIKDRKFPMPCEWTRDEDILEIRKCYAAMIENIDNNIGKLIDAVKMRGELDNTIIIYCADHGEMLGDHDRFSKANPLQGSESIPLVIDASALGGLQGEVNNTPVELQDLAATILDYADLKMDTPNQSISLKGVVEGKEKSIRDVAISELIRKSKTGPASSFCTVFDGRYKLIAISDKEDELYDLFNDPFETNNILSGNEDIANRLKKNLENRDKMVN